MEETDVYETFFSFVNVTCYLLHCKISFLIHVVCFPSQRSVHFFHHKSAQSTQSVEWSLRSFLSTQSVE